jgi:uncharacterized protein YoxC
MKLKLPGKFGQRNPQWANELLGYNTNPAYSIGGYGCLITSFGCYVNKNPHDVNELLKANNGYAPGTGNFIWSKCTVLGLNQVYQSPYYSDPVTTQGITKMKALLDEGRPLITHIDFDPSDSDDDQHWIIVFGHDDGEVFYAHDPWTDTDITLDVYGGVRRCVYEWRAYDKLLAKDDVVDCETVLTTVRLERDRNWDYFVKVCDALGVGANVDQAVIEVKKLIALEDSYNQKDKQISDLQSKLDEVTDKAAKLIVALNNVQDELNVKQNEYEQLQKENTELQKTVIDKVAEVKSLSEAVQELTASLNEGQLKGLALIVKGVKQLFGWGV